MSRTSIYLRIEAMYE